MGRLFWKFFLFIWLAQLAGIFGAGAIFWLERQQLESHFGQFRPPEGGEPSHSMQPPPEGYAPPRPLGFPLAGPRPGPIPVMPIVAGLLASIVCAAGLAWYVAKPIRRLKAAFDAAAEGDLQVRVGAGMGRRSDELADLGRDFDHMTEHLQVLMDGQKRLLHDVSHELRSPLARLQAAIGLARQQPARLDDFLLRIEREGERMNVLVGELLTLSRLEAGVNGVQEDIDLSELLAGLVDDARFEAGSRQLEVVLAETPGLLVNANPALLHRAIENVLRNALRFSPKGGVIRVETSRLANGACRIAIVDQGPGVPAVELKAIFNPFFRGEGRGEGYGLGLAIARRVLAALGGQISAENRPEGGLLVALELPARP